MSENKNESQEPPLNVEKWYKAILEKEISASIGFVIGVLTFVTGISLSLIHI